MSTTPHRSRTRILSKEAVKIRTHTSRDDQSLTSDGKDLMKNTHNEPQALKALAKSAKVKTTQIAKNSATFQNRKVS